MSHIMMTRRILGAGLRRPAAATAAPSPACLATSLEAFSLRDQCSADATVKQPAFLAHGRPFSSAPKKKDIFELPPNLKFDPRVTATPFYGAERVKKERKNDQESPTQIEPAASAVVVDVDEKSTEEKEAEVVAAADAEIVEDPDEDDFDEYGDYESDEDDDERVLYDLSTKPDIPRAIPLPQRLHVPVMDIRSGEEVGTFHLSEKTFGNDPVRVDILQRVVVWQRNKKRGKRNAGARTKTVSEVSGSGAKVRKQKGMGKARAGHSRPAHWRGGAKAHGPKGKIQDYTTKLPKKIRRMGVRHALSQKLKEGNLIVTNDLTIPTHKTRELNIMLNRFGISGKKGATALICDDLDPTDVEDENSVYGGLNVNFKVASNNLPKVQVLNQKGCHVFGMLRAKKLVLSLAAVQSLEERLEREL